LYFFFAEMRSSIKLKSLEKVSSKYCICYIFYTILYMFFFSLTWVG
jgi:hypothetical protein